MPKKRKSIEPPLSSEELHRFEALVRGKKQVLLAARVPDWFHAQVTDYCVAKGVSLKEVMMEALSFYVTRPNETIATTKFLVEAPGLSEAEQVIRNSRADLWADYLDKVPEEKIQTMVAAMRWDLAMKRSARRKSIRGTSSTRKS